MQDFVHLHVHTEYSLLDGACRIGTLLDAAKDFAIYISASSPYEVAVFECYSKNDANEILRMCYERTDEIKVGLRFSRWENQSKFIALQTYGRYVIFAFTDSYERNRETVDKIISLLH